jgi:hypothetical protein
LLIGGTFSPNQVSGRSAANQDRVLYSGFPSYQAIRHGMVRIMQKPYPNLM